MRRARPVYIGSAAPLAGLALTGKYHMSLEQLAYEDAMRQLWPLMGFALRDRLAENERP